MTVYERVASRVVIEDLPGLTTPILPASDALFQASRRVDWRFLFPDPTLRRVGYIGPERGDLFESLRQFSSSVKALKLPDRTGAVYDVVVARDLSREMLRTAVRSVKPGGHLYAEISGPGRLPGRYVSAVKRAGLTNIRVYWPWPNFEACTRIIPLDDPAVLIYALTKGRPGRIPQAEAALVQWLHGTGLLRLAIWRFSLVAEREGA
jgi:SAM-dependent methyltransferase